MAGGAGALLHVHVAGGGGVLGGDHVGELLGESSFRSWV